MIEFSLLNLWLFTMGVVSGIFTVLIVADNKKWWYIFILTMIALAVVKEVWLIN